MTYTEQLVWIKTNFSPIIRAAITQKQTTLFTEDVLAGITCRETGIIISAHGAVITDPKVMCSLMKGDWSKRAYDSSVVCHGFGPTQIDDHSFADFVNSGKWLDPLECYLQTIDILRSINSTLSKYTGSWTSEQKLMFIIAAYNCGAGNEEKVIDNKLDPDAYDTGHNYSAQVKQFRNIYLSLQ